MMGTHRKRRFPMWLLLLLAGLLMAASAVLAQGVLGSRTAPILNFEANSRGTLSARNDSSYGRNTTARSAAPAPPGSSAEGDGAVVLRFAATAADVAAGAAAVFVNEDLRDLSAASGVLIDVYAPEPGLEVSLSLTTGAWVWHQSKRHPVSPGWSKLQIPLDRDFAAARSGWLNTTGVAHLEQVERLAVLVYASRPMNDGVLIVDNLRGVLRTGP